MQIRAAIGWLLVSVGLCTSTRAAEAPPLLAGDVSPADFVLVDAARVATVHVDAADHAVARIAAGLFADDVRRVAGRRPDVTHDAATLAGPAVLIGTLGKSAAIDRLVADGKLDVSAVRGKWETFVIAVVDAPLPGVDRALVIAGSDRRGTAFGALEVSEQIGVSPWYWWADATPTRRNALRIRSGTHVVGPPSVRYRGIFINDEDWGLMPWAAKTFEPARGNIGPKTYAQVFELLLRLKANFLWPAMHPCSTEFGSVPENVRLADEWGIVMGASHAEPMNRNNVNWNRENRGPWRYDTNRDGVYAYWEEYARDRGPYEAVWTVGMRGIHDSGMGGPRDIKGQVALLGKVIQDQRGLLAKHVSPDVERVPQAFMPYKEALGQYQAGLKVPDDVTLVWCEDNFGYIRQLSTPDEQKRSGGSGVYYHISYLGTPKPYLWINTTPPALIWQQMQTALAHGADRIWVLNVGDIKPGEIGVEFWTKLAWKTDRWGTNAQEDFLREWARREFGDEHAGDVARLMNDFYALGFQRKPELMESNVFSPLVDGEARARIDAHARLLAAADALAARLPAADRDAFFEMVLYPVRVAAHTNHAYLYADLSHAAARQRRPIANAYARRAADAVAALERETAYYNDELAGGKWKGMMQMTGWGRANEFTNWAAWWFMQWPSPASVTPDALPTVGIAIDGKAAALIDGKPVLDEGGDLVEVSLVDAPADLPWQAQGEGDARVIGVPNGAGLQADPARAAAIVRTFNLRAAGRYNLFGHVVAPTPDDDSFFVRIDDGPWLTWNDIPASNSPAWRKQGAHELSAGAHTIAIANREDGAHIRALRLTQRDVATEPAEPADAGAPDALPTLVDLPGRRDATIRLFRTDGAPIGPTDDVEIVPAEPWITVGDPSPNRGDPDVDGAALERVHTVRIDWPAAPAGRDVSGSITVRAGATSQTLIVRGRRVATDAAFVEVDGVVSIEAEHYTSRVERPGAGWVTIPHLGRSGDAVTVVPASAPSLGDAAAITRDAPSLAYAFDATSTGDVRVLAHCLPTYRIHEGRGLRYAVSIDDAPPTIVDFAEDGGGTGEHGGRWLENTRRNVSVSASAHRIDRPGRHTLRLWMVDPNVVVDKLVIDLGGLRPSELGPPETRRQPHAK